MLLVQTYLAPSSIQGLGLFAAAPVAKRTVVWSFNAMLDRLVSGDEFCGLPSISRAFVERYGFLLTDGTWVLCGDDARFMNHSSAPCLLSLPGLDDDLAERDVAPGEELTCDYGAFDTSDWRAW